MISVFRLVDNGMISTILGSIVAQTSPGALSVGFVPSKSTQKKPDVLVRQTTSLSSRDDSDDDDLDGDTETADNGDPTDKKRARRCRSLLLYLGIFLVIILNLEMTYIYA